MHRILFIFLAAAFSTAAFGQSGKLTAYLDQKLYFHPESGPYIEIHYQFSAPTLKYKGVENGLQATVANSVFVTDIMNDTVFRDAYVLESPLMRDSIVEDFFDLQRIPLKPGRYIAHIQLQDVVSLADPLTGQLEIVVPDMSGINVSDIMVAEVATPTQQPGVFSKSGYDILPRISNFYPEDLRSLPYYVEVYNTSALKDTIFGLRQRVINTETEKEVEGFSRFTKMNTGIVVPALKKLDISKLPSGSYRLEVAAVDKTNTQLGKPSVYFFDRINEVEMDINIEDIVLDPAFQQSITDDSIDYYLASLMPISRPAENKSIITTLKQEDKALKRRHLQQFWTRTSGSGAYEAWMKYKGQVQLVQRLYSTNYRKGFETDRGRVYLQYGPPNSIITKENNNSEYPYEIWHYYKIKVYSNKRFIFYNPDLVTNTYTLLHSDMLGEVSNYRWQHELSKRNSPTQNIDDPNDGNKEHYGGNSNYYYRQY